MSYTKIPKMILFDVGGTLFVDGKCIPRQGLSELRKFALNPDVTDDDTLAALWDEYMDEVNVGLYSKHGAILDIPLSATLKYITMKAGLHFNISMAEQEEIFDRFNSTRQVMDGLEKLLRILDEKEIRTAVISNNAMCGDSLALAIRRWIPSAEFEFCLTSADILLKKPEKSLFLAAASFAGLAPCECWYCGDKRVPDVDGAKNSGMLPVLIDTKSVVPLEYCTDGGNGEYMLINHWNRLCEYIKNL